MNMLQFIQTHIVKNAETIDNLYIRKENNVTILPIMKQTPRKIIKTAEILISEAELLDAPKEVIKVFYTPNVKKKESEISKWLAPRDLVDCIERGLLIKEVRFKKDGKTVDYTVYRMGYGLFLYMEEQREVEKRKEQEELQEWIEKKHLLPDFTHAYTKKLLRVLDEIEGKIERDLPVLEDKRWSHTKVLLFLEFLLALYRISCEKRAFDWKEIGAMYYQSIGGSKKFDAHKKEFLDLLEQLLDAPPHCFGLVSLGTVTPIFFCGDLREGDTHYLCDTVRAVTDLAVFRYEYRANAKVLWLVENRAVLTRMAAEENFLSETGSLVIGVDGQLRSGHKKLIQSVLTHSESITKIMIWTDYDRAGKVIRDMLFEVVEPYGRCIKWISPESTVLSKQEYEETVYLRESEQEEQLGGAAIWKAWINH
ncbi:TPA: histidine kinase [Bacillus pseudomycoides]|nr:histidine kinase [Bacillus pseudomycoides]